MRFKATVASQLAVIGIWLLISTPAFSQDYARNGFYIGAGALGARYMTIEDELERDLRALGPSIDTDIAVGFELYGGYRFHPNFAVEAEFEMLPEADIDLSGFGTFAELETWTITANLKAFLPIRRSPTAPVGRIHPYLLVGIGGMRAEIDDTVHAAPLNETTETESGFAARFGGGVDVYLTEHIVASAGVDYLLPTGDVADLDYISWGGGIQYRF